MNRNLKAIGAAVLAAVMCASFAGCAKEDGGVYVDKNGNISINESKFENHVNSAFGGNGGNAQNSAPESSKPEPKPIEPFENLEVVFEGISPKVTAEIKGKNSNVNYTVDRNNGLKNGDKITVTAEISSYKKDDFVLTYDSKEFTVSNRPYYIMKLSELTDNDIQKLRSKVEELADQSVINHSSGGSGSEMNSFEFLGNVLYTNDRCKYLFFVYKANTTFAKTGETLDYYFLGYFQYVYKETDGVLNYYDGRAKYFDLGDMSMVVNGRYYGGYTTLDGVYNQMSKVAGSDCQRESNIKEQ